MKNKRVRGDLKGIEEQLVPVRSAVYATKIISMAGRRMYQFCNNHM